MAKLIGTMDHLNYGSRQPQYVIEYGGRWYYGSSTVWYEIGGIRQDTMTESALYTAFCRYEFEVKSGKLPVNHYTIKEIIEAYDNYLSGNFATEEKDNRPKFIKITTNVLDYSIVIGLILLVCVAVF